MKNYNSEITTKVFKLGDLYDGIFAQSFGNKRYIYQLTLNDGGWYYQSRFKIEDSVLVESVSDVKNSIRFLQKDELDLIDWCETIWTRKLNKLTIREDKLKELGI